MKKPTKKELTKYLIENFKDENGYINLSNLDFGDYKVDLSKLKAFFIINKEQQATCIFNEKQKSSYNIYNEDQKAYFNIFNGGQKAHNIYNKLQVADRICNEDQEADILCCENKDD